MTTTVTVSEFRDNLAKYLDLLKKKGNRVKITDGRKGTTLTTIAKTDDGKEFDWDEYIEFVKGLGGSGLLASRKDVAARKRFRESLNRGISQTTK